ncbi:Flp pilus assembly protein CpaB [Microvirga roseola]|uniref:Flp pilus assembly protein CpaB n=1 Tax=Microvirga roseola TaxID=2883126 RepID=UPI001E5AED72|nr:Flp pilus assembly protein CpaB [Microvirga roseola]
MLRIIVLVIAIGAGCLAAWLALSVRTTSVIPPAMTTSAPSIPMEEILVAAEDLAQGQAIAKGKLRWQPWPQGSLHPNFISRQAKPDALASLEGALVRNSLVSGEPIREDKLVRSSSGLLSALLPAGKRAIAIRVSAESTAGGFILPNDRVDVIQTIARQPGNQSENLTRTVLNNIRVLAVDQRADDTKRDAAVVGKTVTLELSPAQAEVIASGQATGALSLALRSVVDADEIAVERREVGGVVRILRAGRSEIVRTQ